MLAKLSSVFHGPSPFAGNPCLVVRLDLEADAASELARGCDAVRQLWPEWFDAQAPRDPSPVVDMAQTAAQWALAALNQIRGYLHDAGAREAPGGALIWLGFHHEDTARSALELALAAIAQSAASPSFRPADLQPALDKLENNCRKHHPDYQARILMLAAAQRGVPALPFVPDTRFWQFGWGTRSRVFEESSSNADGMIGDKIQRSKIDTKQLFAALGVPAPKHRVVRSAAGLEEAARNVGFPCVIKPEDGGGGKGVTAGIASMEAMLPAFELARSQARGSDQIVVEAFVPGEDHRLMLAGGRLVAAIRREPSSVTGDGRSTIGELIGRMNAARSSKIVPSRYLRLIPIDQVLATHLATQGTGVDTVLPPGRRVTLRSNSNLSTGGICTDVTGQVHPQVKALAEHIARAMGLDSCGLDYMTTAIAQPHGVSGGQFIEANTMPGMEAILAGGWAPEAVGSWMLGDKPGRIPATLIVVPQSDLPPILDRVREASVEEGTGWACGTVSRLGALVLDARAAEPWGNVRRLLRLPALERVTVVASAERIARRGLPLDRFSQALVCDELAPEWLETLQRHTDAFERFPSWPDALAAAGL